MLLNTVNFVELMHSLADIFSADKKDLLSFLQQYAKEIINGNYNEYTIDYLDFGSLKNFCNCNEVRSIDEIVVNHIAPRENQGLLVAEDIMTLPKALTTDTALSRYLKDKKFEFEFVDSQIIARRNGEVIDWNKLKQSNIFVRFGGPKSLNDFNVNGYLFVSDFILDRCKGWLGSPEILKSIANAYGERSIADDYAEKCRNYFVSFKVPLNMVDIESTDTFIDQRQKSDLLIKYSINALTHYLKAGKYNNDFYNPIIMLKRDYNVPHTDIIKVRNLKIDYPKVRVIDD